MTERISRKPLPITLALALLITGLSGCACHKGHGPGRDILFQASTINALLQGVYDGEVTFGELAGHGDFGIGTFNQLDGEMLGLDGTYYRIRADGKVYPVDSAMKTPFAAVTFFDSDRVYQLGREVDYDGLKAFLDGCRTSGNLFSAIRIDGTFAYIKTRSVPRQTPPYPQLVEVIKDQPIFEFSNVKGSILGFYCPDFVQGINVPGYHFHFVTEDRSGGGHLLACRVSGARVEMDDTSGFYMVLPQGAGFSRADLAGGEAGEMLDRVEKE